MTAKTYKPSYETEGTTVFMPYIIQTALGGLLRTLTETGLVKSLNEQDEFGTSGPFLDECIFKIYQWMHEAGIGDNADSKGSR